MYAMSVISNSFLLAAEAAETLRETGDYPGAEATNDDSKSVVAWSMGNETFFSEKAVACRQA
jgi:hypothetical protein